MAFEMPKTNWIWVPGWESMNQEVCHLAYFRKTVTVETLPQSLRIRVSADTRYKFYVNGRLIGVGPSRGDKHIWFVDELELAPYLVVGENILAVEVLRYPLTHQKGNHGMFRTSTPGLYVAEVLSAEKTKEIQGKTADLITDLDYPVVPETEGAGVSAGESWKCRLEKDFSIVSESMFFAPLQILESRAGDFAAAGWRKPGYDDSHWDNASAYVTFVMSQAVSPGNLVPRTIPYMRLDPRAFEGVMTIRQSVHDAKVWDAMLTGTDAVTIPAHTKEVVEINAGELTTGYLTLSMKAGAKAKIKMLTSEAYVKNEEKISGNFHHPKKKDRCDFVNGHLDGFTDTYIVCGYGNENLPECYEPYWFRTFRFIQLDIETADEPLTITGFDYKETGYPLEPKTRVEVSDQTLAPVWDISLRTLKRCMHETYEDCPFYEQLQYAMDSRSQILYTYAVSGDDRLARKCMDDFRRSQRYDGMTNCSYPCYGPNIIPGFSIYYLMMLYDHMMYFGDKDLLRQHMGAIDGILEYFNRNLDTRGLVGKNGGVNGVSRYWSFIDWTTQWDKTAGVPTAIMRGPITMESFLYVMGLTHAAQIMDYLGRDGVAAEYRKRADAVRRAINTYCVDENGMYMDGPGVCEYSQHCQVFAILTDTVQDMAVAAGNLQKTLEKKEDYAQCSVAMAYYLFRALEKAGLYALTDDVWNLWRKMVENNLTTCVEDGVNERSDCHAWGALALYELPSVTLGVHPLAPGYAKIGIAPKAGYMDWAKGDVITPQGNVHVEWTKNADGTLNLTYTAPEGADVIVTK